jgi:hypothetical protein
MTAATVHPLLLAALRGGDAAGLLPRVAGPRAWAAVLDEAAAQGLTPLLYRWLKASEVTRSIPEELADRLEREAFALAARNMLLADELGTVLRACEEEAVPCVPIRGPALAERLYGDITARPMGDLDVLVRKDDLPRVAAILEARGFRRLDRRRGFAEAFSYTLVFVKDRHGWLVLEPHWTIVYPPFVDRLDMSAVWARCVRGRVLGAESWLLGREDLLLHLCLHLMHPDGGAPLLWFYELDRLLRQDGEDVDWSAVLSLAREAGCEILLAEALGTVGTLFGTPVPGGVIDQLARRRPRRSGEGRLARLLAGGAGMAGREELAVFFSMRGVPGKLRYALGLLFPDPQFMRVQHGASGPAGLGRAYLRRFGRLLGSAVNGTIRLLSRASGAIPPRAVIPAATPPGRPSPRSGRGSRRRDRADGNSSGGRARPGRTSDRA